MLLTVGSFAFPYVPFLENPSHSNLVSLIGRYGLPEEVAGLVKFLALDPAAAYITGQVCVCPTENIHINHTEHVAVQGWQALSSNL
jgi:NAD(P)-dependent dehydrogenase (short-subunit alcohol dehydrogenase family)